ncbi:MAG: sulfite exporter TauE/SafE family protein, partial [Anaerolineales bacterium]|nr:sulfite exporter TauE/SafE family protein [Anaerolineales bacterium]
GLYAFKQVNPEIIVTLLGIILVAYAVYGLIHMTLPELKHPYWAYLMGFIAGIIGGAYNTSGPPVIIYGNCRRWPPKEFKGNLQGYFLVTNVVFILVHLISENLAVNVWKYF